MPNFTKSTLKFAWVGLIAVTLIALPACGSGKGFRAALNPLVITSASLPPGLESGQQFDFEIPIDGGCGGPYVVQVISPGVNGGMPDGIATDDTADPVGNNHRHHLTGIFLEDGHFEFVIQITDTSCTPFLTTTMPFVMDVGIGPVQIVAASPAIIPVADYTDPQKFNDADALETVVFGQFAAIDLIGAGGVPPYSCDLIDDPLDQFDSATLPLGVVNPPGSCSLVGQPGQVGPGGAPFRFTFQITDSIGNSSTRKLQWKVDTPPIIIATETLPKGRAGTIYSEPIQLVDGVPPFLFDLTDDVPDPLDNISFNSPLAPTINADLNGTGFSIDATGLASNVLGVGSPATYPAPADLGPNYAPFPPEGLAMGDFGPALGTFSGIPRRVGTFTIYVHAYSSLVPNERGQHAFKDYTFQICKSEDALPLPLPPDPFGIDYAFTSEGVQVGGPKYNTLPEFEVGQIYNPDIATHGPQGLQLLCRGGVPYDGVSDGPLLSQVFVNGEPTGLYSWTVDWDPTPPAAGSSQPPGIDLVSPGGFDSGVLAVVNQAIMQSQGRQIIELTVADQQLPTGPGGCTNITSGHFGLSVGPDTVIITESSTSDTATTTTSAGQYTMNEYQQRVRKLQVIGGAGLVNNLSDGVAEAAGGDLIGTLPPAVGLGPYDVGKLISGAAGGDPNIDILRVAVNPTGCWDDMSAVNANAARPAQKGDSQHGRTWIGNGYRFSGNYQPSTSCVDLPNADNVPGVAKGTFNKASGVYADGGHLYAFESNNRFGFFIIRNTAKIYVPFAIDKGTYQSFGDSMVQTKAANRHSATRMLQIAVSPDGRFAVCKLHTVSPTTSTSYRDEHANSTRMAIFSLTGETVFPGGRTYVIIEPGAGAVVSTTSDEIQYATAMAMTNEYLYYLIGCYDGYHASYRDHFIMRYEILSGVAAGALAPGSGANWTQNATTPMQTTFHKWDSAFSTVSSFSSSGTTFNTTTNDEMHLFDGANFMENDQAPAPFRINWNGDHCAMLAGPRTTTSGSSVELYRMYAWVDPNGAGFRQVSTNSTARRATMGGGRGYGLSRGPNSYRHWGTYTGPTPGLEINEQGDRIAFVCHDTTASVSPSNSSAWAAYDQKVLACSTTNGWTSASEVDITSNRFASAIIWRFGSLVFTKDGDGLLFWAGYSNRGATSASTSGNDPPQRSFHFSGTYFSWNFNSNTLLGALPTAAGGSSISGGLGNHTASTFSPATTNFTTTKGVIRPIGGFKSTDGRFFYVTTMSAVSGSNQTANQLIGFNIASLTGPSINGKTAGRGFLLTGWPQQYGFLPGYHYYPHYALDFRYYAPGRSAGFSRQVVAKDTGWVFFAAHYQWRGPNNFTGTSSFSAVSGPETATYWADEGFRGGQIFGFDPNVAGEIARLNHDGLASLNSTSSTAVTSIIVSDDGTRMIYQYNAGGSTRRHDRERIGIIRDIGFDATTGAISAGFNNAQDSKTSDGNNGRAGASMAVDTGGTKYYYAYRSGATNNNAMQLVEANFDPATGNVTHVRLGNANFSVLKSGR